MKVDTQRLGRFRIKAEMVSKHWEELLPLMGQVVTLAVIRVFPYDVLEYKAFSPLFKPWPAGTSVPLYRIRMEKGDHGGVTIMAEVTDEAD